MCVLFLVLNLTTLWMVYGRKCPGPAKEIKYQQKRPIYGPFIISGEQLHINKVPHQCAYTIDLHNKPAKLCGCVILNDRFVLTAAHCFDGFSTRHGKSAYSAIKVKVGVNDIFETTNFYEINGYVLHEKYLPLASLKVTHDIAIMMLAGTLQFNKNIQPIKIVDNNEYIVDRKPVYVSGYGRTEPFNLGPINTRLWGTNLVTVSLQICKEMWARSGVTLDDTSICAKAPNLKLYTSVCHGDSGGPMITNYQPPLLIGLTSYGATNCTQAGDPPAVFTNVRLFYDWIKLQMDHMCGKYGCVIA